MKLKVGSKVKFKKERQQYTVQASDERYAVCNKSFNAQHTTLYTIIDFVEQVRGTENLVFGMGAETREHCEQMLDRLNGRVPEQEVEDTRQAYELAGLDPIAGVDSLKLTTEVSYRNRVPLDIERIDV